MSCSTALLRDPCSCALIWEADKREGGVSIINSHADTVSHTHIKGMHTQSLLTKRQMHISSSANAKADGADEGIKPLCQTRGRAEPCGGA